MGNNRHSDIGLIQVVAQGVFDAVLTLQPGKIFTLFYCVILIMAQP